jgi:TfoX/Sxy family transcriptional regulator of competence genes
MAKASIPELEALLNSATAHLPKTASKKMFGCHAIWAKENVFALVWKHGRIGVKLPDEGAYKKLMSLAGSDPWKAGPMQMAHWVLVPEDFHSKPAEIRKWAAQAHALCSKLEKKPKKASASKRK